MRIITDDEGAKIIRELCDVALKQGGIKNLEPILKVIQSIKVEITDEKTYIPPVIRSEECQP